MQNQTIKAKTDYFDEIIKQTKTSPETHPENKKTNDYSGFRHANSLELKVKQMYIAGKGKMTRIDGITYEFDEAEVYFPTSLDVKIEGKLHYNRKNIIANDARICVTGYRQDPFKGSLDEKIVLKSEVAHPKIESGKNYSRLLDFLKFSAADITAAAVAGIKISGAVAAFLLDPNVKLYNKGYVSEMPQIQGQVFFYGDELIIKRARL